MTFEVTHPPVFGTTGGALQDALIHGCGVTGRDEDDCWRRVRARFGDRPTPALRDVMLDIDVSTLDPVRVLPGVGNPAALGVWFPVNLS